MSNKPLSILTLVFAGNAFYVGTKALIFWIVFVITHEGFRYPELLIIPFAIVSFLVWVGKVIFECVDDIIEGVDKWKK